MKEQNRERKPVRKQGQSDGRDAFKQRSHGFISAFRDKTLTGKESFSRYEAPSAQSGRETQVRQDVFQKSEYSGRQSHGTDERQDSFRGQDAQNTGERQDPFRQSVYGRQQSRGTNGRQETTNGQGTQPGQDPYRWGAYRSQEVKNRWEELLREEEEADRGGLFERLKHGAKGSSRRKGRNRRKASREEKRSEQSFPREEQQSGMPFQDGSQNRQSQYWKESQSGGRNRQESQNGEPFRQNRQSGDQFRQDRQSVHSQSRRERQSGLNQARDVNLSGWGAAREEKKSRFGQLREGRKRRRRGSRSGKRNGEGGKKSRSFPRRHLGLLLGVLAAVLVVIVAAQSLIPTAVFVTWSTFDGNKSRIVMTRARKLSDLLQELGPSAVSSKNMIFTAQKGEKQKKGSPDEVVKTGMSVKIIVSKGVTAEIGGKQQRLQLFPGTVAQTLKFNNVTYTERDLISPGRYRPVTATTKIVLKRVTVKEYNRKKSVDPDPDKDKYILDSSLYSGHVVEKAGKSGSAIFHFKETYINGKKAKTEKKRTRWIKKPVHGTVRLGTNVTGENGTVKVSGTFTGNTTAYYFGKNATGAAGSRCHYGTCAVDPSVIPLGTKLYVEGYGIAVANDTGSAVKGHVVDLYMRSYKECVKWGRRYVKVYILA